MKIKILVFLNWYCEKDSKMAIYAKENVRRKTGGKVRGTVKTCRGAAGDVMQDTKAGNGVTLAAEPVYEGGICLTLICTIKELLIFT